MGPVCHANHPDSYRESFGDLFCHADHPDSYLEVYCNLFCH